ncbi:MAG TPA: carboxypeptidase-like regulatory domain-containing protein [Vicinamibacterales bacterium]|nr:carboxypeptidase-like regulatory domain-containing protein [Vicinamibacterales bacterium]
MLKQLCVTLGLLVFVTVAGSAQVAGRLGVVGPPGKVESRLPKGEALIKGTALDMSSAPLANAPVRLRNLLSNQIEQTSFANELGEFTFLARPEVPYVVEITDRAGRVLAVGDIITAQVGDVAGAIVTAPTRLPALGDIFGDSAGLVASAASGLGVTATGPKVLPEVSPER